MYNIPGLYLCLYTSYVYMLCTRVRIPCGGRCIVSSSRPDPRAWVDATPGRRVPKTSLRGLSSLLVAVVFVVIILLLSVRGLVHSSPPFNSHEMNIDWQVPRVGARGGVTVRVVVVVFCCCSRHRVTTPVTVVRGVGSIMSPRNFPSSSSACRLSVVVVAAAGVVVVRLRHGVSRT